MLALVPPMATKSAMKKALTAMKTAGLTAQKSLAMKAVMKLAANKKAMKKIAAQRSKKFHPKIAGAKNAHPPTATVLKRPGAKGMTAKQEANKRRKAAAWTQWSPPKSKENETDGQEGEEEEEEEEEPVSEEEEVEPDEQPPTVPGDPSPITKAQRHVFAKSYKKHAASGGLTEEMKALYGALRTPKERNEFINALLLKNTKYSDELKITKHHTTSFRRKYTKWAQTEGAVAMTETEMAAYLGGGDLDRGRKAIQEGVLKNHIIEKDGMMWLKRGSVSREEGGEDSETVANTTQLSLADAKKLAATLAVHHWAKFSLLNHRLIKPPAGFDELTSQPASEEAQQHLQDAFDAITSTISGLRSMSSIMTLKMHKSPAEKSATVLSTMEAAMGGCNKMESSHLAAMAKKLIRENELTTDIAAKTLLKNVATPFKILLNHQRELTALGNVHKPKKVKPVANCPC